MEEPKITSITRGGTGSVIFNDGEFAYYDGQIQNENGEPFEPPGHDGPSLVSRARKALEVSVGDRVRTDVQVGVVIAIHDTNADVRIRADGTEAVLDINEIEKLGVASR